MSQQGRLVDESGGSGVVETLTGNVGGAVGPDGANNINVLGSAQYTFTGNPGTNTLTLSDDGTVPIQYDENVGSAVASSGVLNILGLDGIETQGSGNTVTIGFDGTIATQYDEDTGSAVPASGVLNVLGSGGISTSGSSNTITISGDGTIATQYDEDSGSAVPSGGILNVIGDPTGIATTSGSGNTVSIYVPPGGINWVVITQASEPSNFVINTGYICQSGGTGNVSIALPATSSVGDMIEIVLSGATTWTITQGASQQIRIADSQTTLGAGGSLSTTGTGDHVRLVCEADDTLWVAVGFIGNLTVV